MNSVKPTLTSGAKFQDGKRLLTIPKISHCILPNAIPTLATLGSTSQTFPRAIRSQMPRSTPLFSIPLLVVSSQELEFASENGSSAITIHPCPRHGRTRHGQLKGRINWPPRGMVHPLYP